MNVRLRLCYFCLIFLVIYSCLGLACCVKLWRSVKVCNDRTELFVINILSSPNCCYAYLSIVKTLTLFKYGIIYIVLSM